MKKQLFRFSAVGAMAFALLVGVGTSAMASSTATLYTGGVARAVGSFTSDGETFRIKDVSADGRGVQILYFGPQDGICTNNGGSGTTKTCDKTWPEGVSFYYRVQLIKDGVVVVQSANIHDVT